MKWALLSGASLDSLKNPVGGVGVVGDVGKSPESVESEKNPRRGGGGRFKIDLPGLMMGMAEDDGEGEEGDVGTDDEEAIRLPGISSARVLFGKRRLNAQQRR